MQLITSISRFNSCRAAGPSGEVTIAEVLDGIKTGRWQDAIVSLRAAVKEHGRKSALVENAKRELPAVTFSGTFNGKRSKASLDRHSRFLCVDFDDLANPEETKTQLKSDPRVLAAFVSPTGTGLKALVPVDAHDADSHQRAFVTAQRHFEERHGLTADKSCRDVTRLCFMSYDSTAFVGEESHWKAAIPFDPCDADVPDTNGATDRCDNHSPPSRDDIEGALMAIPTRPDYDTWLRISSAVFSELPKEEGCSLLNRWSPEESPGEYSEKYKHRLADVGIGTLFYIAREHGWRSSDDLPDYRLAPMADAVIASAKEKSDSSNLWSLLTRGNIADPEIIDQRRKLERDATFVLGGMALEGQATVFYMQPNGGKTLLTLYMLTESIRNGKIDGSNVIYLNADDTFAGANIKAQLAAAHGFNMIIPGSEGAMSCEEIIQVLNGFAKTAEASGKVIILDTLKKFQDLMNKEKLRNFNKTIRGFVQAGGTVIALAHTNKYKGEDGRSVYEGTGDVVADFDCVYIADLDTPKEQAHRQVTFRNDKQRGPVEQKLSFVYDAGEGRTWQQRFDSIRRIDNQTAARARAKMMAWDQLGKDQGCVDYLRSVMREAGGPIARRDLIRRESDFSRRIREKVLDRYDQSNPEPEHRFWKSSTNSTGGKSYVLGG